MKTALQRMLDHPRTPSAAAAITLAMGLFFVFVWAPHPWGWRGIDQYDELARALVRGEPFPTTDVPWGYAYYVAAFYRLFGAHAWIPVMAQAVINALVPLLLYRLVRPFTTQRVAALSSVLVGLFSFNTVYASTLSSDAVCTVLFLAALLSFVRADETMAVKLFVLSGVISGLVPQFRPNMILFPLVLGGGYVLLRRTWAHAWRVAVFWACIGLVLSPWIVRNYMLTGTFLPTSTHGGVQLWYGTLQAGPYLESRAHNPRTIFESAPFTYTSLSNVPLVISIDQHPCVPASQLPVALVYWTDRHAQPTRVSPFEQQGSTVRFEVPKQTIPTALYYYLEAGRFTAPLDGALNPYVAFVSDDHLGDLDARGDLLDIFDLIRMARHLSWGEPLPFSDKLDLNADGQISDRDLSRAVALLLPEAVSAGVSPFTSLSTTDHASVIHLVDQSTISVPRTFSGRHTDLAVEGGLAGALASRWRTFTAAARADVRAPLDTCPVVEAVRVNDVYYRREPHQMRRYMALALDNIGRDPIGFALASAYRMVRLFVIRGTDDTATTQQFRSSRLAYAAGTVFSSAYLLVFVAGVIVAWRQRSALLWLLVPVAYVPLTICFVLTNMRYTITVQPLMFVFVALAVVTALRLEPPVGSGGERG
ncbi:MAG: glycosyltransferase family 39 protein [Vicinamibacterales bacterium]